LTIAEIPAHTHSYTNTLKSGISGGQGESQSGIDSTGSTGGGGGHSHTISSADNRPEFATVLLCEKD
jgi:hypothetical protein